MFETFLVALNLWTAPVQPAAARANLKIDVPVGLDTWQSPDVWSIPVYAAAASDPLQPVLYNEAAWWMVASGQWKRSGNAPAMEAAILQSSRDHFPFPGNVYSSTSPSEWKLPPAFKQVINPAAGPARFHARGDMLPAPGPDGHMAVRQPDGTVLETYATIVLSTGQIVALSYGVSSLQSPGDGGQNGQTASMIPCYLGVTDDQEITAGAIKHAMAITVPARYLSPQIAYPAYAFDRNALTEAHPYAGALPMGAHLALSPDVDIAGLNLVTAEGRTIAEAAKTYGFIIVDRGGEGFTIRLRRNSDQPNTALRNWSQPLQSDLNAVFAHLVVLPERATQTSN
ncbi:MAG TPA: hypothetical protein VND94_01415 [Terriglobia bacterium]|nr:hypothetical protein [Terriglobia bacterium]